MKLIRSMAVLFVIGAALFLSVRGGAQTSAPEIPSVDTRPEGTDEEPKLSGTLFQRASGGFLTLEVQGGFFVLRFFDEKKKPVQADAARAAVRWSPKGKIGDSRSVLNPTEDGAALKGTTFVQPPYTFRVFLTLLSKEGGAVESYNARFEP